MLKPNYNASIPLTFVHSIPPRVTCFSRRYSYFKEYLFISSQQPAQAKVDTKSLLMFKISFTQIDTCTSTVSTTFPPPALFQAWKHSGSWAGVCIAGCRLELSTAGSVGPASPDGTTPSPALTLRPPRPLPHPQSAFQCRGRRGVRAQPPLPRSTPFAGKQASPGSPLAEAQVSGLAISRDPGGRTGEEGFILCWWRVGFLSSDRFRGAFWLRGVRRDTTSNLLQLVRTPALAQLCTRARGGAVGAGISFPPPT